MDIDAGRRFLALMKRYCIDYVNVGDQSVTRDLMVTDYQLRMGDHLVRGRDSEYHDATARQMVQFPGLMLTVHEIATSGERLMMRFSEHGRRAKDGALCAWGGIGLYRWDGTKLTHNNVEQDYWSRRRQIADGVPDLVDHPAIAPFASVCAAPDPAIEQLVTTWLEDAGLSETGCVLCDDRWLGHPRMQAIDQRTIEINDLFSVGNAVAFHVTQHGTITEDFDAARAGENAHLHAAGIVHVSEGRIVKGRVIRNRMDLMRAG